MILLKRTLYSILILLIVGFGVGYFYYETITFVTTINSVFMISLLFIMIGAMMFVTRGGFFDAITLSFRRFMKKGTKYGEIMEDVERMDLPSEAFEYTLTEPMLFAGVVGFLSTVLVSLYI